jgi:hypothetical protein
VTVNLSQSLNVTFPRHGSKSAFVFKLANRDTPAAIITPGSYPTLNESYVLPKENGTFMYCYLKTLLFQGINL